MFRTQQATKPCALIEMSACNEIRAKKPYVERFRTFYIVPGVVLRLRLIKMKGIGELPRMPTSLAD